MKIVRTNLIFLILCFYTILVNNLIYSQVVYVPLENNVYEYLERLSIKKIININDEAKPFSRIYVSLKLEDIEKQKVLLNNIEIEELEFYKKEYAYELKNISNERFYAFSYSDSLFSLKISPIAGYGISRAGKSTGQIRWWGGSFQASYSNWFAAHLNFRDVGEFGGTRDGEKFFIPKRGYYINYSTSDDIEYNDVNGSINFNWAWGSVSLIKDYNRWGHGTFGQLILSDKAAAYPHIKLILQPVEWLRFYYIHGWLTSNVPDSIYFYPAGSTRNNQPVLRQKYVDKFVAINMLSVTPFSWMDLSLGNSVIYSYPTIRPEYLIPFLLFKFQDHNAGRDNDYGNNGQLFADIKIDYPKEYSFYSTLFIDMMDTYHLLQGKTYDSWFGYTFGLKKIDLLFDNLDFIFEYTRINPWVYEHYITTTNYKHLGYDLGHWLGQNADQIRVQLNYKPLRGLKVSGYFERLRKGGLNDVSFAYDNPDEIEYPFLYEPLRKDFSIGMEGSYEITHDFMVKGSVKYSNIKDEVITRTPDFLIGEKLIMEFNVSYGF